MYNNNNHLMVSYMNMHAASSQRALNAFILVTATFTFPLLIHSFRRFTASLQFFLNIFLCFFVFLLVCLSVHFRLVVSWVLCISFACPKCFVLLLLLFYHLPYALAVCFCILSFCCCCKRFSLQPAVGLSKAKSFHCNSS